MCARLAWLLHEDKVIRPYRLGVETPAPYFLPPLSLPRYSGRWGGSHLDYGKVRLTGNMGRVFSADSFGSPPALHLPNLPRRQTSRARLSLQQWQLSRRPILSW